MTVETTQPSGEVPATVSDDSAGSEPVAEAKAPRTVEEVEAEYQGRISGKDRAHAAEVQTLTQKLSAFEEAEASRRQQEEAARQANMTAEQRREDDINRLQRELEAEKQGRVIDARKARFPNAAADLGDEVMAAMDEAKLAALEVKLGGQTPAPASPTSMIDPNSVVRQNGNTPRSPEGKTSDELKADLALQGAAFLKEIQDGRTVG